MCACSNNKTLQFFKEEQKNVVEQVIPNIIQKLNLDHTIRKFKPKVGFSETFKFLKEFRDQLKSISTMMKLCLQKENKEKTLELTLTAFNSYMINKYFKKIDILTSKKASVVLLEENLKKLVELMTKKMKNNKQMVLSALITYNDDNIRKIK